MVRLFALGILFVAHLARAQPATDAAQPGKPAATKANAQPATVTFVVKPWGEVLVDGELRGVSPPLKSIKIEPGERAIIIKNPGYNAYADTIILQPGEELTIQHAFSK